MFLKSIYRSLRNKRLIASYSKNKNSAILMFHSILESKDKRKSFFLDKSEFINFIKRYNQQISSIEHAVNNPYSQSIVITFDDIRDDVYKHAVPILVKEQIPFTVFINISLLDKHGYITTEQLQKLASYDFITIGSHCYNHKPLKHLPYKTQFEELSKSKQSLEKITNRKINYLAYPYGQYDKKTIKIAKRLYDTSFVSYGGLINSANIKNKHKIHRQGVDDSTFAKTIGLIEKFVIKHLN